MANGSPYVTWQYMDKHERESNKHHEDSQKVKAEVMGDIQAGRPSLRKELQEHVDAMVQKVSNEHRKTRITIISGVSVGVIVWIINAMLTYGHAAQGVIK